MKLNKYLLIVALATIANVGCADSLKERMEKVAALSDEKLNAAYFSASSALIKNSYDFKKAEYACGKCKDRHPDDHATVCESLNNRFSEMWRDRTALEAFDDIVYEKYQRELHEGFVGRGSKTEIIGSRKVENGRADLYRAEKGLRGMSEQELLERRKKASDKKQELAKKEELSSFDVNCLQRNDMKLLAIKRELKVRYQGAMQ